MLRALNSSLDLKSHEFESCWRKTKLEMSENESWSEEFGVYWEKLPATIYLAYFLLCGRWIWAIWIQCCPYLFELEYTDEELLHREERMREWGGQQAEEGELAAAKTQSSGNWWCSCGCCNRLPTQGECLYCQEWDLLMSEIGGRDVSDTIHRCVTTSEDFPPLINRAVLETFFVYPK